MRTQDRKKQEVTEAAPIHRFRKLGQACGQQSDADYHEEPIDDVDGVEAFNRVQRKLITQMPGVKVKQGERAIDGDEAKGINRYSAESCEKVTRSGETGSFSMFPRLRLKRNFSG